jgi:hypothetical protein
MNTEEQNLNSLQNPQLNISAVCSLIDELVIEVQFENFLNKYAEDNFGFDPEGNPAYYVDYYNGIISMGSMINPKFQPYIVNDNKDDRKQYMIELAEDLINVIKENFNQNYYLEFTTITNKKVGFILKRM